MNTQIESRNIIFDTNHIFQTALTVGCTAIDFAA